jgi:Ca2+-binding EF-hand superfamily protein
VYYLNHNLVIHEVRLFINSIMNNFACSVIVDKIDKNNDGFIDMSELKAWIQFTQRRYIQDDIERQWRTHNPENNDTIHWATYSKNVYGFMDDMNLEDLENGLTYKAMLTRDRRRWSVADREGDHALNRSEFTDFLHPEESSHMRDIVVSEAIEDVDKDNDGKISVEEYIGDMYRVTDDDAEEPEWVKHERETFKTFRDKDSDGFLNSEEVRDWIIPHDFDHAEAESKHLIYEVDSDSDEKLTKEEILDKYDVFVGSQATEFGENTLRFSL